MSGARERDHSAELNTLTAWLARVTAAIASGTGAERTITLPAEHVLVLLALPAGLIGTMRSWHELADKLPAQPPPVPLGSHAVADLLRRCADSVEGQVVEVLRALET